MNTKCIKPAKMLLPNKNIDLNKWAVIACDQYTSDPKYWDEVQKTAGDAPSALHLTLPEIYLEETDADERIHKINDTMKQYLNDGTLEELEPGMMLVSRNTGGAAPRKGIVMAFDLEAYDYTGKKAAILPTEKTVESRIPARAAIRKNAVLELPHIMILFDDPNHTVIEPVFEKREQLEKKYDVELMQQGGHLEGWFLPEGEWTDLVTEALSELPDELPYCIGDGNHSMAAAKADWERIKKGLTKEEQENHPARYVLAELVNIHDESLVIEPIHRVLFHVTTTEVIISAYNYFASKDVKCASEKFTDPDDFGWKVGLDSNPDKAFYFRNDTRLQAFLWCAQDEYGMITLGDSHWEIPISALQDFLDDFLAEHPKASLDYVHGIEDVKRLAAEPGNFGFILPNLDKQDLFAGVITDGVLPRKTFSMGEAREKRYYMEARKIR